MMPMSCGSAGAARGDEQRRNPCGGHFIECRSDRSVGADEPCRRHQIPGAVAVRIAVDARARALPARETAFRPAGAMLGVERLGHARHARSASARVRMFLLRSRGISASNTRAAASASPRAEWRSVISTPSHAARFSSEKSARLGSAISPSRRCRAPPAASSRGRHARTRAPAPRDRSRRCARSGSRRRAHRRFRARRRRSAARPRPSRHRSHGHALLPLESAPRDRSAGAGFRSVEPAAGDAHGGEFEHARLARIEPVVSVSIRPRRPRGGSCAARHHCSLRRAIMAAPMREITALPSVRYCSCADFGAALDSACTGSTRPAPTSLRPAAASSRSPTGCRAPRPA